ncbi:hypothetical protein Psuf_029520 [Phytohabitans suffuscus]|uniref:Uncharacterized protein n=1 Tax=Phytohabitans suffuscus TaxID=624315 RepID=A0A6F8YHZ6_9ACTN|nr:hypothetical protein Psuf_029520 [Phytohabitans suffuscus]
MGKEPDVLDDVPDAPAQLDRVDLGDVLAVEQDPAGGGLDQPVDHAEHRGLATARRSDEDHELAGAHLQAEVADGDRTVRKLLPNPD